MFIKPLAQLPNMIGIWQREILSQPSLTPADLLILDERKNQNGVMRKCLRYPREPTQVRSSSQFLFFWVICWSRNYDVKRAQRMCSFNLGVKDSGAVRYLVTPPLGPDQSCSSENSNLNFCLVLYTFRASGFILHTPGEKLAYATHSEVAGFSFQNVFGW